MKLVGVHVMFGAKAFRLKFGYDLPQELAGQWADVGWGPGSWSPENSFYGFCRKKEWRENTAVRVSVQGGPILWEEAAP